MWGFLDNDDQNDDELQEFHTETEEDIKYASTIKEKLTAEKGQDDEEVKIHSSK